MGHSVAEPSLTYSSSKCVGSSDHRPRCSLTISSMHFGEMIIDFILVEFFLTNVTPVRITPSALNVIAAIGLERRRIASGTLWYVDRHRGVRARFTGKIIGSAKGYVFAATFDGTDLFNLGAALAPSVVQAGVHASMHGLQVLFMKQTFCRTIVLDINIFLGHHFTKGTNQV